MSLADDIRTRLTRDQRSSNPEHLLRCAAYGAAVAAVLDEHPPLRIYGECGHEHAEGDPGVLDLDEVGRVCEAGYEYTICGGCCCDDDGVQTSWCAAEHCRDLLPCWPCPTVKVAAHALGVETSAVTL